MREKIKTLFKRKTVWICLGVCAAVLAAAAGVSVWWYQLTKFRDVTVEFGAPVPELQQFLTEYGSPDRACFVTDVAALDYCVGQQQVTLKQDWKEETVTLTIRDTTAPTAVFQDLTIGIGQQPTPEQFVVECADLSGVTISFAEPLETSEDYVDKTVTIVVADPYGNVTRGQCAICYVWLKETYTLELGSTLEESELLLDPEQGLGLLNQENIEEINTLPAGEYIISGTLGGKVSQCTVTVQDTTPPEIVVEPVVLYKGRSTELENFIVSASDLSGEVTTRLMTELDFETPGFQTVVIEAEDPFGNVTTVETTLQIILDSEPPYFTGVSSTLQVKKNQTPNYTAGVSAKDAHDGKVSFTYDASKVDTTKAGTYYVTYTATDISGNVATYRRKVEVAHDEEDTAALVAQHAAKCGNDPETIRDYVRNLIRYSHDWGGDDAVWYGFTNRVGNCYVHARCLQALLTSKGYENQLIHTTDKTHYWVLVKIGTVWRHIDATPGTKHTKYSLMTDEMRLETLQGRKWDFSAWPACE